MARRVRVSPRPRSAGFHQILILLLGSYFLGGEEAPLSERVAEVVADGARRERAVEAAQAIEATEDALLAEFLELHARFYDVVDAETLDESALRAVAARQLERLEAHDLRMLEGVDALRAALEVEEWSELFGE